MPSEQKGAYGGHLALLSDVSVETFIDALAMSVMMAITTITLRTSTKRRLADYKWGDGTYDDVLNMLMDRVPLEDVSREQVREHYRRLRTFQGIPKEEFKASVKARRKSDS